MTALATPALLFDVFGTLVDWRGSLVRRFTAFGAAHGLDADWAGLVDAWRGAYAPAMDRVRRGERAWATIDTLHREALDELLPRFGLASLGEESRTSLVMGWHELDAWPDVAAGLERLRARRVVATLSNANLSLQIDLVRHAGLRFDALFSAEHFRHYKPDAETYLGAAALLGLEPGDVMLCAAHVSDLAAARTCGLRTALINRPLEYGAGRPALEVDADAPPDHTVRTLDELSGRLAEILQ